MRKQTHHSSPKHRQRHLCSLLGLGTLALLLVLGLVPHKPVQAKGTALFHTRSTKAPAPSLRAYDFSPLIRQIQRGVFNISVEAKGRVLSYEPFLRDLQGHTPFDSFFEEFFRRPLRRPRITQVPTRASGSGFLINARGYALTNHHVIRNATKIKALLADGRSFDVEVIGKSPMLDLALIRLKAPPRTEFPFAYLGDSDSLAVGEPVIAIGNARGLGLTVTAGIVSAKGRVIGSSNYDDYIQTDAAINQGNSGGPLFNRHGEVVGINTAILRGGRGIGFALPINLAKRVLPQLQQKGKVERAQLGVVIQKLTPTLAKSFGLTQPQGALVVKVMPGSPAQRAGLRTGDIILRLDGQNIRSHRHLSLLTAFLTPGKTVSLRLWRNKRTLSRKVRLRRWKQGLNQSEADATIPPTGTKRSSHDLGLRLGPLTHTRRQQLRLNTTHGVEIRSVKPGSLAAQNGIQPGDIILEINRTPVKSVAQCKKLLANIPPGEQVLFLLRREQSSLFLAFPLE